MIERILVAVDDSAPALAAARFAADLARTLSAELNFVTIVEPGRDPDVILQHVATLARDAQVDALLTAVCGHHPFETLLAAASDWGADVVVMGRSDKRPTGRPYVGSQTEHLLEFSDIPVVVVPEERVAPPDVARFESGRR